MAKYYKEMKDGTVVSQEEAFDYAAAACGIIMIDPVAPEADEFREILVEWFFSGNWLEKDDEDEQDD